jgi:hypothetical protein
LVAQDTEVLFLLGLFLFLVLGKFLALFQVKFVEVAEHPDLFRVDHIVEEADVYSVPED